MRCLDCRRVLLRLRRLERAVCRSNCAALRNCCAGGMTDNGTAPIQFGRRTEAAAVDEVRSAVIHGQPASLLPCCSSVLLLRRCSAFTKRSIVNGMLGVQHAPPSPAHALPAMQAKGAPGSTPSSVTQSPAKPAVTV